MPQAIAATAAWRLLEPVELWHLAFTPVSASAHGFQSSRTALRRRFGDGTSVKRGAPPCMKGGPSSAEDFAKDPAAAQRSGEGANNPRLLSTASRRAGSRGTGNGAGSA